MEEREMPQPKPWLEGIAGADIPRLIESDTPVICVIAGPGSGKTLAIERRIKRVIEGRNVQPGKIFVGAFNREIARQLSVSVALAEANVEVSTLHSLAYRLLVGNPVARQGRNLRILLSYETEPMLYDVGQALDESRRQDARASQLKELEATYARRLDLEETAFQGEVDRWLREHGAMLLDEFVPFATRALESGDIPAGQFDHVAIDEYQDLTQCEQFLVELIWSRDGSLLVCGDDDQSIYSFRYNHPYGITGFGERWADLGVEHYTPPENHRSGAEIVEVANRLMAASGASKPPMESRYSADAALSHVYWETMDDEINGLAEFLKRDGAPEYLVLVPLRIIGYRLRDKIGDDAATSFHEEVLESNLARERFVLASVLANPIDRVALRSWFGHGRSERNHSPKWNAVAYASLRGAMCGQSFRNSPDFCRSIVIGEVTVRGGGRGNIIARAASLVTASESAPNALTDVIDWLFNPELSGEVEDEEERSRVRRDLEELRTSAQQFASTAGVESLKGIVGFLRYRIATRMPLDEPTPPRVRITTLHSAKGLQSDRVVIAGLTDQIIPGPVSDPADREERRRLLYVAVTRARQELILSRSRRMRYADAQHNRVRIDDVRRISSDRWVMMGASSFIPRDFPVPAQSGPNWLRGYR